MAPLIRFVDVHKSFSGKPVLNGIDFTIESNETTCILGPSGVGKTVILKLITGLIRCDRGQIILMDRDITHFGFDEFYELRRKFGMLFQDAALFDSLSVGENIAFPLRCHENWTENQIAKRVDETLALVGLDGISDYMPAELSGGMRKRVGLARAIVLSPELLLFDEPNSGLDPIMSETIDRLIIEMKRRLHITFLVISHDIIGTLKIADRIGLLFDGKLVVFEEKQRFIESGHPKVREFLQRYSSNGLL